MRSWRGAALGESCTFEVISSSFGGDKLKDKERRLGELKYRVDTAYGVLEPTRQKCRTRRASGADGGLTLGEFAQRSSWGLREVSAQPDSGLEYRGFEPELTE